MITESLILNGEGYRDVFFSKGWRVSFADYSKVNNDIKSITKMEKHLDTDEAFVLLKGNVVMVTAGKEDKLTDFVFTKLEKGRIYVIEKGEWHVSVFQPDSEVLIVENEKESDSMTYYLSTEEYAKIVDDAGRN